MSAFCRLANTAWILANARSFDSSNRVIIGVPCRLGHCTTASTLARTSCAASTPTPACPCAAGQAPGTPNTSAAHGSTPPIAAASRAETPGSGHRRPRRSSTRNPRRRSRDFRPGAARSPTPAQPPTPVASEADWHGRTPAPAGACSTPEPRRSPLACPCSHRPWPLHRCCSAFYHPISDSSQEQPSGEWPAGHDRLLADGRPRCQP